MKIISLPVLLLPVLAGCLSPAPKAPAHWTIDRDHSSFPPSNIAQTAGAVRIVRVGVSAPYNGTRLSVLRPDGSVAFDAFNAFAVSPNALLSAAARDAVRQYGPFKYVLAGETMAKVRYALEFDVTALALDCREKDGAKALVEVCVTLLDGRDVVAISSGCARVAAEGDYSAAFSSAFFHAVADALCPLPFK